MSDCCLPSGSSNTNLRKQPCPSCGVECVQVSERTILHHIKQAWTHSFSSTRFYFCHNASCETVYFGLDGSQFPKGLLNTKIGIKESSGDSILCYCFGITRADFENDPASKDFVVKQTQASNCSCETANPSGRCCLKDFPK